MHDLAPGCAAYGTMEQVPAVQVFAVFLMFCAVASE
jgi:hypothetical protein